MNKSYILISFTSSQNQTLINLIYYLNSINIHKSDIYIFTNSNDNLLNNLSIKVIRLKKISSLYDSIEQFFSWSNKKTILKKITIFKDYNEIEIIFPHFLNILSNYFYHNCIPKLNHAKLTLSLYPDGVLSFQPFKTNSIFQKEVFSRWISSYLFGMPFKPFIGPIADPYNIIKKIYTYIPKATIKYNAHKLIKISFPQKNQSGDNLLILGHFNQSKFDENNLSIYIQKIIELFPLNNFKKIYYKKHPRLENIKSDDFFNMLNKKTSYKIKLINNYTPIETSIENIKVQCVIAAVSTSLINLKLKYGNNLNCYYFGLNNYVKREYVKYYFKVFNELSITPLILENDC